MLHRFLHALNGLLLAGLFGYALATYPDLPDPFPRHFDLWGRPDGWVAKSLLTALMMPLVALGGVAVLYAVARLSARRPEWVNVPGKVPFRDWPAAAQQRLVRALQTYLYATSAALAGLFWALTVGTVQAAHTGTQPRYVLFAILGFLTFSMLATPFLLAALFRAPQRATRAGVGAPTRR